MALTTLEALQLDSLSPNRFPVVGTDGVLTDGRIQRAYSNAIFLLGDDAGPGGQPQITGIGIRGLPEIEENSRLYLDITSDDDIRRVTLRKQPYPSEEILAQVSWETLPPIPGQVTLLPQGLSGVEVDLEFASLNNDELRVAVAFSTTAAAVAGDEDAVINAVILHGVTRVNSDQGRLTWRYENQSPDYHFIVENESGVVARAVVSDVMYFPDEFALVEENASGISGTVTLSGFEENREGGLVVKVAQGVLIDSNIAIDGNLSVGQTLSVAGNVTVDGNLSGTGDFTIATLAGNEYSRFPLAVDHDGTVIRDSLRIQQIFGQTQLAGGLSPEEGLINLMVPEQPGSVQRGITVFPEEWWGDGKRFTLRASFRWERETSGTGVSVEFTLANSDDTLSLFSSPLPESGSDLSGSALLEIDLIVTRLQYETETLELRGFYRFNETSGHISLLGKPTASYSLSAIASFAEDDNANVFTLDTASLIAYERPRALEG